MERVDKMINFITRRNMAYQHQNNANAFHHIKYRLTRFQSVLFLVINQPKSLPFKIMIIRHVGVKLKILMCGLVVWYKHIIAILTF